MTRAAAERALDDRRVWTERAGRWRWPWSAVASWAAAKAGQRAAHAWADTMRPEPPRDIGAWGRIR